jgi:hypothetical protein
MIQFKTMSELNPVLTQGDQINPYKVGLIEILYRLKWDLCLEAHRSRRSLAELRNKHSGGKAVIVCNGPSLNQVDLSSLKGVFCFGLNKINLLFDRNAFRPDCIVAVNPYVIDQNAEFYVNTKIPLFLDSKALSRIGRRDNIVYVHGSSSPAFARDCSLSLQQGYTVTYVAMQLAFHLGFRNVALVGCDHSFSEKGPANMTVKSKTEDQSHFDSKYFSGGVSWQLPDLAGSEYFYTLAARTFNAFGGEIVNCTDGGNLEVFRRQQLRNWLSGL